MLFAELATKRSSPKRSKFFWTPKKKTPLVGAAFTISEGGSVSGHRLDARRKTRHATRGGILGLGETLWQRPLPGKRRGVPRQASQRLALEAGDGPDAAFHAALRNGSPLDR